jgi:tetratricopeptide (TPR) repeat protein
MLSTQQIDPTKQGQMKRFILIRWIVSAWHWLFPPTVADQDRQSSTARLLAKGGIAVLCLCMVALAFAYARPLKNRYDTWQADRLVDQAQSSLESEDPVSAFIKVQEAVQIDPDHAEAIRINAQLLTSAGQNQALFFWQRLRQLGVNTLDDDIGNIRALLRVSRNKEAGNELNDLLDKFPADARLIKVAEEVWGKGNANERTIPRLKAYTDAHPTDGESRLHMVKLQLVSTSLDERTVGRANLRELAATDTEVGRDALRLFYSLDDLSHDERRTIIDLIGAHPLAEEIDRVTAFDQKVSLKPLDRSALVETELGRVRALSRDDQYPLARWLVQHKEYGTLLAFLQPDDIKTHENHLLNYMSALTALGRNAELETLISDPSTRIARSVRTFYKTHLYYIQALANKNLDMDAFRSRVNTAKNEAVLEKRSDLMMILANYAETRGLPDMATEIYRNAAQSMRKVERSAVNGWMNAALKSANTTEYRAAVSEASRRWPDDQTFAEHKIYGQLLLGESIESRLADAIRLLELRPEDSLRKILVALGYWRIGDIDHMVDHMQKVNLNDTGVTPGHRVMYAGMMRAGNFDIPAGMLAPLRTSNLLPEERATLERCLH